MKKKLSLLWIISLLSFTSCFYDPGDDYLVIRNKSSQDIGVFIAIGNLLSGNEKMIAYPDTILPISFFSLTSDERMNALDFFMQSPADSPAHYVASKNSKPVYYVKDGLIINDMELLPTDTLSIYIFATKELKSCQWETICEENRYLVRYDLSSHDFDQLRKRSIDEIEVPFPPSAKMKGMKMWPPYDEVIGKYE